MDSNNITFPIYNADGTPFNGLVLRNATFDSVVMSLGDKITGDVYYRDNTLAVTMSEYIEYKRNEDSEAVRFVLVNPPTVVREGIVSDNSELHGMTKYSFVFYHPMYAVSNFPFTDVAVSPDEQKYLSNSKTFNWIGNLFDMVAKLNKNLQSTQWVVGTNIEHYEQDGVTETSMWQKAAKIPDEPLSFDKTYVSEVLKTSYETWEIPFVVDQIAPTDALYAQGKRFLILFGTPSNEILDDQDEPYIFRFGQGVGLKNNSRTPKNNKIVTRIVGYGSENNIPFGYPQIQWFGDQTWKYTVNNDLSAEGSLPIYKGILGGRYVNLIKHPFTRKTLMPSVYRETLFNKVSPYMPRVISPNEGDPIYSTDLVNFLASIDSHLANPANNNEKMAYSGLRAAVLKLAEQTITTTQSLRGSDESYQWEWYVVFHLGNIAYGYAGYVVDDVPIEDEFEDLYLAVTGTVVGDLIPNPDFDPTIELVDYYDADTSYVNPVVEGAESVEIHQFEDIKPEFTEHSIVGISPYDGIECISLSEFNTFIQSKIDASNNENEKSALQDAYNNIFHHIERFTYTGGSYTFLCEYGKEIEYSSGVWSSVKYTSSNVSFTYNVYNGSQPPSVDVEWDDTMDDDGNYKQSYFKMTLPQLDFDLYACASITEEMKINMRSGACIGCTFDIAVDWDDYKKNFYDSDGNFVPDGEQRDLTKYPKTNLGQVTFVVKKDLDTFGTLMPNTYQQPHSGDEFVILGISLPTTYVTNAEARLDDAAKEYMRENNVYYYEYPLKFDEHFLATHKDILSQIRNNTIVRFQYGGELPMALYVKQMTVKYSGILPTYDITLTDDVEIVLNQIGQATDDISRMRVQVSELQKYYSENIIQAINEKLSKVVDDVCLGRITFQQGLDSIGGAIFRDELRSPDFTSGLYTGRGWRVDQLGNAEFESVRARSFLEVVELLVNRMQAQEGDTAFTDNDQIDCVEPIEYNGTMYYRLAFKEKWAGYLTSQVEGNILRGIANTLAANLANVSTVSEEQSVEADGENKYYTSWMRVVAVPSGSGITLGNNQVLVELYSDANVPAKKNFPPCELMTVTRWGHIAQQGETDEEIARLQRSFVLSNTDGRITKLVGVDSPILNSNNYGTTLGTLPQWVLNNYATVRDRYQQGRDYLYAQGIVVEDFIKIDANHQIVTDYIDKGTWVVGQEYLATTLETHDVWYEGQGWRCKQTHTSNINNYPQVGSAFWKLLVKKGENGTSFSSKGTAIGHYANFAALEQDLPTIQPAENDLFILDTSNDYYESEGGEEHTGYNAPTVMRFINAPDFIWEATEATEGDGYMVNNHLFVANETFWGDMGNIQGAKGDDGQSAFAVELDSNVDTIEANLGSTVRDYRKTINIRVYYGNTNVLSACTITWVATDPNIEVSRYSDAITIIVDYGTSLSPTNSITFTVAHPTYGNRTVVFNLNTVEKGQDGQKGDKGDKGDQGKMGKNYYYGGTWDTARQDTFTANDQETPYFAYNNNKWVYIGENFSNYTIALIQSEKGYPQDNGNWQIMVTDFKYLITEAIFSSFASLGCFIVASDYFISQYGTLFYNNSGMMEKTVIDETNYNVPIGGKMPYAHFDVNDPEASTNPQSGEYKFAPILYQNAKTGRVVGGDCKFKNASLVNCSVNGLVYANQFLSSTYQVYEGGEPQGSFYFDFTLFQNETPHHLYVLNGCGKVTLPPPSSYDMWEIQLFQPSLRNDTHGNSYVQCDVNGTPQIIVKCQDGGDEWFGQADFFMPKNQLVTLKSINSLWWVVGGDDVRGEI